MSAQNPAGLHALVNELGKRLTLEESNQFLGGTRGQGVWTPRDAYDALETAVNKFLFDTMAAELIGNDAEALGKLRACVSRLPTQSDRTHEQNELPQFSTPPTLAFIAAKLLDAKSGDTVLEPSAGTGSLAIWAQALGGRVVCNEIHPRRRELLRSILGFETFGLDAEIIDDVLPPEIRPDAVLMNAPFTATGGRVAKHRGKYGLLHIESALRRLGDGGRLVAITSGALAFGRAAATSWWQKIDGLYQVRANFGFCSFRSSMLWSKTWLRIGYRQECLQFSHSCTWGVLRLVVQSGEVWLSDEASGSPSSVPGSELLGA
jgi:protein strawberry notch